MKYLRVVLCYCVISPGFFYNPIYNLNKKENEKNFTQFFTCI